VRINLEGVVLILSIPEPTEQSISIRCGASFSKTVSRSKHAPQSASVAHQINNIEPTVVKKPHPKRCAHARQAQIGRSRPQSVNPGTKQPAV
jgi:hypothetical protein